MRNGTCPSCGMSAVYVARNGIQHQDGVYIYNLNAGTPDLTAVDSYVCTNCGRFESYIADRSKLDSIEKRWQKVG